MTIPRTPGSRIPVASGQNNKTSNQENKKKEPRKSSNNRVSTDDSKVKTKITRPSSTAISSAPKKGLNKRAKSPVETKPDRTQPKATRTATTTRKTIPIDDVIAKIKKAGTRKTINDIVSKFKQSLPKTPSSEQRDQLGKVEQAESERAVTLCCYNILVGCKMLTPNKNQELTGFKYSEDGKSHDFLYALDVFLFGSQTKKPLIESSKNGDIKIRNIDKEKQLFTNHGISKNTRKSDGIEIAQNTRKPIKNKEGTRTLSKDQAQNALGYLIKNSGNTTTGKQSYKIDDYQLALTSLNAFLQAKEKAAETKADPVDLEVLGEQLKSDIGNAVEKAARAKAVKGTVADLVDKTVSVEEEQPPMQATRKRIHKPVEQANLTHSPTIHKATLKTAPIEAETVSTRVQLQTASTETLKKATKQTTSKVLKTKPAKPAESKKAKAEAAAMTSIKQLLIADKNKDLPIANIASLLHQQIVSIIDENLLKSLVMEPIMANHKDRMGLSIIKANDLENACEHCNYCIAAAQYLNEIGKSVEKDYDRGVQIDTIAAKIEEHMATVDLSKVDYTPAQQGTRSWLDGYYGV